MALWINHCFGPLLTNINGNQSPLFHFNNFTFMILLPTTLQNFNVAKNQSESFIFFENLVTKTFQKSTFTHIKSTILRLVAYESVMMCYDFFKQKYQKIVANCQINHMVDILRHAVKEIIVGDLKEVSKILCSLWIECEQNSKFTYGYFSYQFHYYTVVWGVTDD